jgi:uncharacterized protein (TIGR02466 family)
MTDVASSDGVADALVREIYFPSLIYFRDLRRGKEINDAIRPAIYAWREAEPAGIVRSNIRGSAAWHSPLDMHQRAAFRELVVEVLGCAATIFGALGYDPAFEPALSNMWANINPRNAHNRSHVHPNVLWSGVYYVQTPRNCGRLLFTDPRPQATILTPIFAPDRERQPEMWSEVYFEAIEGRLLLFPAWLQHEVEPNLTDVAGAAGDRISVSFNLVQRRRTP